MSTFKKLNDTFVSCPFNKHHQVLQSKLQYHIVRCMVNYPDYKTCPYHACHRMKPEEYQQHVDTCPYRCLAEDNADVSVSRAAVTMGPTNEKFNFEFEDWTKDAEQGTSKENKE